VKSDEKRTRGVGVGRFPEERWLLTFVRLDGIADFDDLRWVAPDGLGSEGNSESVEREPDADQAMTRKERRAGHTAFVGVLGKFDKAGGCFFAGPLGLFAEFVSSYRRRMWKCVLVLFMYLAGGESRQNTYLMSCTEL
jgi:hypothetical protein